MPRKAAEYSRVTEVIDFVDSHWKPFWYKHVGIDEAERISKESTDFGKGVHTIAEGHLLGTEVPPTLTERQQTQGGLLVKWIKEADVKPLLIEGKPAVEIALKSEQYKLTGHPDLVCSFGSGPTLWVTDWKTSKDYRRGYGLQMAAYAYMLHEMYGITVDDGVIVRTPSDPNASLQFETHEVHGLRETYWPVFLSALEVFNYLKRRGYWKGK